MTAGVGTGHGIAVVADGQVDALLALLAGDPAGTLEHLVLTYQDRLYRFALRFSASPQDAEEIVQDAFVRAYQALITYTAERIHSLALRPWLYQITLNVARNRLRRKALPQVSYTTDDDDETTSSAVERFLSTDMSDSPEAQVERGQDYAVIQRLLATLPARYRAALLLRYVEELSYAEVALALKKPVGTVKSDVHRGLTLLRLAAKDLEVEVYEDGQYGR